jgi:UDP-N-acetylmuramoylalanine--D-glutamate ligase
VIPVQGYRGRKVAVLGMGRSGIATAHALRAGGATPVCWDESATAQDKARDAGFLVEDLNRYRDWPEITALIVSPGIPHLYPAPNKVVRDAWNADVRVDNDIGLFFQSYATEDWDQLEALPKVIGVTGSNGKSTTSALIHHVLQSSGRATQLGGNIGRGVLDLDPAHDGEVVVLELSSYQTEFAKSLTPDVAVFLNLSPDHLDRHGGMGGYFAAKRRLFAEGGPERAIIGIDEDEGASLANELGAIEPDRVIKISVKQKLDGMGWSVFARKGFLSEWRKGRQVTSIDLRKIASLSGVHNHQNACAAYAACRSVGLAPKVVEEAFRSFSGLPHRTQIVATINGVVYVNDSKATNVDSAAQALQAFDNIHWIAGGEAKDGGIEDLQAHAARIKRAYFIGASAQDFAQQMPDVDHVVVGAMEQAIKQASADAISGDTVLLAPAAASFDQYRDFEHRGNDFIAHVEALQR